MSVGDVHPSAEEEAEAVRARRERLTPKEHRDQDASDQAEAEALRRALVIRSLAPTLAAALRRAEAMRRLDLELALARRRENRG